MTGLTEQLLLHPGVDPDELVARAKAEHRPVATFCLFSGGNDSTVLAHRCREHYETLAFIDTGTAIPGVVQFVQEFAAWIGKPLRILGHDHDEFRAMVLGFDDVPGTDCPQCRGSGEVAGATCPRCDGAGRIVVPLGFPGPAQHGRAYNRLKERQLERLKREAKAGHPRSARVLYLTGVRRDESQRRRGRPELSRKGGAVFANPLIDWSNARMWEYRREHRLPQSDVAALLHRSGECNCGSFAAPGEREDLQRFYPEWFEERIAKLEREAEALGIGACRWGARPEEPPPADVGELCSDCQLRLGAL